MQYAVVVLLSVVVTLSASEDTPVTLQSCDANAVCVGYYEGFNCTCNSGYKGRDGGACVNINECEETPEVCTEPQTCNDIIGSYNCTCGDIDTECHVAAACVEEGNVTSCVCKEGYTGDGISCADIDECLMRSHNCSEDALCTNTIGSYGCTCYNGFEGDGFTCTDIDECEREDHDCTLPLTCNNTRGSFECVCGDDGLCDEKAYCNDIDNTTSCVCNIGYQGDGVECTDVDECHSTNDCHKDAECANTPGSYRCICKTGFTGNGKECSGAVRLSISVGLLVMILISFALTNN